MDALRAYKYYMSLKLHYSNSEYDVFEKKCNIRCSAETFSSRNDSYLFEKLSKLYDDRTLVRYYVSNFAYGFPEMVWEYQAGKENLRKWEYRRQSLSTFFCDEIEKLILNIPDFVIKLQYPEELFKEFLGDRISLESMVILNSRFSTISKLDRNELFLKLWEKDILRIIKSNRFIKYETNMIQDKLNELQEEMK